MSAARLRSANLFYRATVQLILAVSSSYIPSTTFDKDPDFLKYIISLPSDCIDEKTDPPHFLRRNFSSCAIVSPSSRSYTSMRPIGCICVIYSVFISFFAFLTERRSSIDEIR